MEVGAESARTAQNGRRRLLIVLALIGIVAMGLFVRAYWNVPAATEDGFVFSGGSDAYYEKRTIDHILDNDFQSLVHDPLLNYPYGNTNPNPPLYNWLVAAGSYLAAPVAFSGDVGAAAWWATLWAPVIFGVLTIIPVYFLGAALWGPRTGVVAAFFWAFSTSAIDNTSFGDSRHYAAFMFFISLAFLFYVKAIQPLRGETHWVTRWKDGAAVGRGVKDFARAHRRELGFAVLAGISVAATGLVWKGFPYLLGIIGIYAVIQMVVDHWRNRDPIGIFAATLVTFAVAMALIFPYYYGPVSLGTFVRPAWYMFAGFAFVGAILTPTRDLPTVLVMPLFVVGAILGGLVAFLIVPEVGLSLLYSAYYFKKSALYQTIAEAHPADFNRMVFSVGPWAFFATLVGVPMLFMRLRKRFEPVYLFVIVWAVLAIYMAHSAARFLVNAVPVFAVLGAWVTVRIIDWLDFRAIPKAVTSTQSLWQGIRRGTRVMHVVGVFCLALFLVFPTVFFAVDAATPPEHESRLSKQAYIEDLVAAGRSREDLEQLSFNEVAAEWQRTLGQQGETPPLGVSFVQNRLGAFGQNYLPDYWRDGLTWLDEYDAHIPDPADRPGIVSWWDYGHWEIYVGRHPAVADNFQNGYVFAANFLLAQNETQAIQLLGARQINLLEADRVKGFLTEAGVAESDVDVTYDNLSRFAYAPALDKEKALDFLSRVEDATGKRIRYFAVDVRMLPYDNPQTPEIEQTSIFYAPVVLANNNPVPREPEHFLEHMLQVGPADPSVPANVGNDVLTSKQYEERLKNPFAAPIQPTGQFYVYKQPFFNTMYWRAYAGGEVTAGPQGVRGDEIVRHVNLPAPGQGLEHFKLIYANGALRILEFTPGATVTGTVSQGGTPVSNAPVTVMDDAGQIMHGLLTKEGQAQVGPEDLSVAHASTRTDAEGRFSVTVPFGTVTVVAGQPSAELGRATVNVSREEADAGKTFTVDVEVEPASVTGTVFMDANENGTRESDESVATGGTVEIAGATAAIQPDGTYTLSGLIPGTHTVNVTGLSGNYQVGGATRQVSLPAGETTTHNVSLVPGGVPVSGTVFADANGNGALDEGEGASFTQLRFTPGEGSTGRAANTFSTSDGTYDVELRPGAYTVTATTTLQDGTEYTLSESFTVPGGSAPVEQDFAMQPASA